MNNNTLVPEPQRFRTLLGAGFTLIELLVVVLIIGILAAVAVPQYEQAVEKSRAAEALANVRALYQAQLAHYMANGEYSREISELDVSIPGEDSVYGGVSRKRSKWFSYAVRGNEIVIANRLPEDTQYVFFQTASYVRCFGYSAIGEKVCKSFGGEPAAEGGYKVN